MLRCAVSPPAFWPLRRSALQKFGFLGFLRNVEPLDLLQVRADCRLHLGQRDFAQRLVFRLLDADQRRITQLVDAGLDGQHRGQGHIHKLKISGFEFALHSDSAIRLFDLHDDGGVRPAQQLGQNDAGLRIAIVIGLQAGKNQIELFVFNGGGEGAGRVVGIQADKGIVFQMNGAIGALGQGLAQHLLGARRTGGNDDDFAAVLLFLAKGLFERVGVRLIHFVGDVFANPGAGFVEFEGGVLLRHLLHADQNLHSGLLAEVRAAEAIPRTTDCPVISKRLRQRRFLQTIISSLRTM